MHSDERGAVAPVSALAGEAVAMPPRVVRTRVPVTRAVFMPPLRAGPYAQADRSRQPIYVVSTSTPFSRHRLIASPSVSLGSLMYAPPLSCSLAGPTRTSCLLGT